MKTDNPKVLMVGADMVAKGGIASVILMYKQAGMFNQIKYLVASGRLAPDAHGVDDRDPELGRAGDEPAEGHHSS